MEPLTGCRRPGNGDCLSAVLAAGNVNIVMLRHPAALLLQAPNALPYFVDAFLCARS